MLLPSGPSSTRRTACRPQSHSPLTELREASMVDPNKPPPGLKWRKRRTGPSVPYWFADAKAVKAGYSVKSANLSTFADRPVLLRERCERLQLEMLQWLSKKDGGVGQHYDG